MAGLTISGLSSGIDTNTVITSTIAVAAGPQNALKTSLNTVLNVDQAYQTINSKMAALKTAADALNDPATWQATTATSSVSSVVASGSTTALAGTSTTFSVTQLATSQVSTFNLGIGGAANASSSTAGFDVKVGSKVTHLTAASNSASDLVTAFNSANLGVKAALITDSSGNSILQFAATSSGVANSFDVTGLTGEAAGSGSNGGSLTNLTVAQDASITVGQQTSAGPPAVYGPGSYTVTSSSNTFSNAVPGVTMTVSALVSNATVSVMSDPSVASNAAQSLVTAANSALLAISNYTGQGAVLEGDQLVNQLTQDVLGAVSGGSSTGQSFTLAGIDLSTNGTVLTFDPGAFSDSYTADPQNAQKLVGDLATSLSGVSDRASNANTGSLTSAISTDATQETDLEGKISDWDDKLAALKDSLTAKYAAMEAALSKMKSQSTFLSQAFASISANSSTSSSSN